MAIVSVRVEDTLKDDAERIADSIGLTLSSVVNIFLNRFVAEQGFPFPVVATKKDSSSINTAELTKLINQILLENVDTPNRLQSIYPDNDGTLKHTT